MDWIVVLVVLGLAFYADGYSKYGRTCKDIGCLNSEVCVLAEDPCSYGHSRDCGTYPTCKKKSQVGGIHTNPSVPKPVRPRQPKSDLDGPSYKPSAPTEPTTYGGGSPYGGSAPYGGSSYPGGNSHYGGNSPYGSNSPYGGSSPYGGYSPYGGTSQYGGGSPFGRSSHTGGISPYGGTSPYGGSSFGSGGNNPYGGNSPFGGSTLYGGSSSYGRTRPHSFYGGGSGGQGRSNGNALDSILHTFGGSRGQTGNGGLSNILGGILSGVGTNGRGTSYPGGSQYPAISSPYGGSQGRSNDGLSSILSGILSGAGGNGGLSQGFNTRSVQHNPSYVSSSSYQRNSYPSSYNGNVHSAAPKPYQTYGWTSR